MAMSKQPSLKGQCIAEFIGTALLIFFGVGTVATLILTDVQLSHWEVGMAWGTGVAIAIYCTGAISGAHLNPAVTIALAAFHGFAREKVIPYIASQLLGAFFAAAVIYLVYGNLFTQYEIAHDFTRDSLQALSTGAIFSTYPHPQLSLSGAFLVEFIASAVLMFAILALGDEKNGAPRGALSPVLIGLLISVIGCAVGPLTGYAMNPARDFGPRLFSYLAGWDYALTGGKEIPYFILPIMAPIAGACCAAWAYPKWIGAYLSSEEEGGVNPTHQHYDFAEREEV